MEAPPPRRNSAGQQPVQSSTVQSTPQAVRQFIALGPTTIAALAASALLLTSVFLPWMSPLPSADIIDQFLNSEISTFPQITGLDFDVGRAAAFSAGLTLFALVAFAAFGLAAKILSVLATVFACFSAYKVCTAFKEIINGDLWQVGGEPVVSYQYAPTATFDTLQTLIQNGYGMLIAVIASIIVVATTSQLAVHALSKMPIQTSHPKIEMISVGLRICTTATIMFTWAKAWWWATGLFAFGTLALWLMSDERRYLFTYKKALPAVVATIGIIGGLHAFIYP